MVFAIQYKVMIAIFTFVVVSFKTLLCIIGSMSNEQTPDKKVKIDESKQGMPVKKTKKPRKQAKKILPPLSPKNALWNNIISTILIFLVISAIYTFIVEGQAQKDEVPISQLAQDINGGLVEEIKVRGEKLEIIYAQVSVASSTVATTSVATSVGGTISDKDKPIIKKSKKEVNTALTDTLVNYGVTPEALNEIDVTVENPTGIAFWTLTLAPFLLPLLLIGFFIWFLTRQVKGAGMQAFTFGQSKARISSPNDKSQKVTFKDVAGANEAKEELAEIVDFLKNPKKFIDIGAEIPKGILMVGAPGTGKTLLARAVAGEARVAFFSISGSEFVEMFVGVGASRVRDLFKMAKHAAPAIIFIDEIDAVGRARGTGVGGGNDEREQTLNQILVEMDGFEPNEKVIVMAATNRPDVLDSAILRPGRFDRRVVIDLPDRKGREEILQIHSRKKQLAEDVNFSVLAERTPGFSGADLYSLMNEGAILAAREDRTEISQYDLIRSIEKVMLGPERKSHLLTSTEKKITAYHEAGHAIVASALPHADPVHKISIIARGRAGGYTLKLPTEDKKLHSKKEFLDDIAMSLGGYVTEQLVFGDLTTGPSNDLQVSTGMARDMITKYGMSDKIGPIALEGQDGKPLFGGRGVDGKEYSERVGNEIDMEVARVMDEARQKAEEILTKYRSALDAVANRLMEVETIEREEYERIIAAHGLMSQEEEKKSD